MILSQSLYSFVINITEYFFTFINNKLIVIPALKPFLNRPF